MTDFGFTVGTVTGLTAADPTFGSKIATGWFAGYVFPLVPPTLVSEAVTVVDNGTVLIQVTEPGNEHGEILTAAGRQRVDDAGLADRVTAMNNWGGVVGRRQLNASSWAGELYVPNQAIRIDSLATSAARLVHRFDRPTAINDAAAIAGDNSTGGSWLIRPSGP